MVMVQNRLRVAYNDSYRILHNLPRSSSARAHVQSNILTFDALIRKYIFSFISRCLKSVPREEWHFLLIGAIGNGVLNHSHTSIKLKNQN